MAVHRFEFRPSSIGVSQRPFNNRSKRLPKSAVYPYYPAQT
jgi:hypothetical protein